jgi:hypothetical protein
MAPSVSSAQDVDRIAADVCVLQLAPKPPPSKENIMRSLPCSWVNWRDEKAISYKLIGDNTNKESIFADNFTWN